MSLETRQWHLRMQGNAKLEHYVGWKEDTNWEPYLDNADEQGRRRFTIARSGIWELRVETGRWESMLAGGVRVRIPRHLRWCQQCLVETEDLEYVLTACPGYCKIRKEFFGRCAADVPAVVRPLVASLAANGLVLRKDAAGAQADALMKWMMADKGTNPSARYLTELWKRRKVMRYEDSV